MPAVDAMAEHQAMLDTIRDGLVNSAVADIPSDPEERSRHLPRRQRVL